MRRAWVIAFLAAAGCTPTLTLKQPTQEYPFLVPPQSHLEATIEPNGASVVDVSCRIRRPGDTELSAAVTGPTGIAYSAELPQPLGLVLGDKVEARWDLTYMRNGATAHLIKELTFRYVDPAARPYHPLEGTRDVPFDQDPEKGKIAAVCWDQVKGCTGYVVEFTPRLPNNQAYGFQEAVPADPYDHRKCEWFPVSAGQSYYWRVRAVFADISGPMSEWQHFTVAANP